MKFTAVLAALATVASLAAAAPVPGSVDLSKFAKFGYTGPQIAQSASDHSKRAPKQEVNHIHDHSFREKREAPGGSNKPDFGSDSSLNGKRDSKDSAPGGSNKPDFGVVAHHGKRDGPGGANTPSFADVVQVIQVPRVPELEQRDQEAVAPGGANVPSLGGKRDGPGGANKPTVPKVGGQRK
ncbi:hypothetical protein BDR26DRAFT_867772 [Obelidium mucronatum]|nr:hypothetical protein BDR26DRAFT_867772 [Obelidium mucronatum]